MSINSIPQSRPTLSDRSRKLANGIIQPVALRLHRLGVNPDAITLLGLVLVAVAAYFIAQETLWAAGLILLLGLPLDALDGAVARLRNEPRPFGAFLDSTLDRYADGLIFSALVVYGQRTESSLIITLGLFTLIGAYLVSYTRARAEGLGLECKVGFFTRMERVGVLLALLLIGAVWSGAVVVGLLILAAGTQLTALQRIWHVWLLCEAQKTTLKNN